MLAPVQDTIRREVEAFRDKHTEVRWVDPDGKVQPPGFDTALTTDSGWKRVRFPRPGAQYPDGRRLFTESTVTAIGNLLHKVKLLRDPKLSAASNDEVCPCYFQYPELDNRGLQMCTKARCPLLLALVPLSARYD